MRLMTHAHTPERRQQALDEARREEREALTAYRRAERNGASGAELLRLADEWRAAREYLAALEQAESVDVLAPNASERCWGCRRRFDRHVLRCRVSVVSGRAACQECAERLDLIVLDRERRLVA